MFVVYNIIVPSLFDVRERDGVTKENGGKMSRVMGYQDDDKIILLCHGGG